MDPLMMGKLLISFGGSSFVAPRGPGEEDRPYLDQQTSSSPPSKLLGHEASFPFF